MNDTEEKLKKIVDDIKVGNINSKTVQSNKKIREYLNTDDVEEPIKVKIPRKDNLSKTLDKDNNTITDNKSKVGIKEQQKDNIEQLTLSELDVKTILPPEPNIKKEDIIIFSNINIDKKSSNK